MLTAPNAYEIDDEIGKDSPRYTMPGRAKDPKAFKTPAPGAYDPKDDEDGPRYSFGLKPNLEKPNNVPGQCKSRHKIPMHRSTTR